MCAFETGIGAGLATKHKVPWTPWIPVRVDAQLIAYAPKAASGVFFRTAEFSHTTSSMSRKYLYSCASFPNHAHSPQVVCYPQQTVSCCQKEQACVTILGHAAKVYGITSMVGPPTTVPYGQAGDSARIPGGVPRWGRGLLTPV